MSRFQIHFLRSGMQTTWQDLGRSGYQHRGIPIGGAMDRTSATVANRLVGNEDADPLLEITLIGPTMEISGNVQIAVTGADLSPTVNDQSVPMWETVSLVGENRISFGKRNAGTRSYLAVGGKVECKTWLGSVSAATVNPERFTPQSVVSNGDTAIGDSNEKIVRRIYPAARRPEIATSIKVRLHPGPEFERFSVEDRNAILESRYLIDSQSNRMGFRLNPNGAKITPQPEIISSGVVPGTLLIPNSGDPILLMRDAQTTGGYPRFGVVAPADLNAISQMCPGDLVQFVVAPTL
jgi:antagonist of KipI